MCGSRRETWPDGPCPPPISPPCGQWGWSRSRSRLLSDPDHTDLPAVGGGVGMAWIQLRSHWALPPHSYLSRRILQVVNVTLCTEIGMRWHIHYRPGSGQARHSRLSSLQRLVGQALCAPREPRRPAPRPPKLAALRPPAPREPRPRRAADRRSPWRGRRGDDRGAAYAARPARPAGRTARRGLIVGAYVVAAPRHARSTRLSQ